MTPEDWQKGMENEAASVQDAVWSAQIRRTLQLQEIKTVLCLITLTVLAGTLELGWFSWDDGTFTGQLLGDKHSPGSWIMQIPWLLLLIGGWSGWFGAAPRLGMFAGLLALPLGWLILTTYRALLWDYGQFIFPPVYAPLLLGAWIMLGVWIGNQIAHKYANVRRAG